MCIAVGGVPDSHNITIFHLCQPITTSMGNKLHNHMFVWRIHSVYLFIETLYGTKQVSLLILNDQIRLSIIIHL